MNNKTDALLLELQADYIQKLPHKISELEASWNALLLNFNSENLSNFHRLVHSLCGSSGTYGFPVLSQAVRDLEIYLKQLLDTEAISSVQSDEISHLLNKIKEVAKKKEKKLTESIKSFSQLVESNIIYLIDDNLQFAKELGDHLEHLGFKLILLKTISDFAAIAFEQLPAAVLIDGRHLDHEQIETLIQFKNQYRIPIICIAYQDDLTIRLKAVRGGASHFFQKNMPISELAEILHRLCQSAIKENYRILILDDTESLANYYALILREAGMTTRAITNPMHLLSELSEFNPDLLLMDLYMPECSGLEIATILRQDERYTGLPILFISTEDNRFKQLAIMSGGGAEDFLTKPILPQHLIAAVKARARRAEQLLSYMTHDSLTQLLNHTYILQQLELELLRAKRLNGTLTFAMVDLDHFKKINDQYGHPTGDIVLKKIAHLLSTRLRKTDFIGRYGGEEFAVVLPNTTVDHAIQTLNQIRENIANFQFETNGNQFYITLSIGIATYPEHQTSDQLVTTADQALYKAKSAGRNKIVRLK